MAEKANVIVKFMLSARKRRGIYFFSATIFIITIPVGGIKIAHI